MSRACLLMAVAGACCVGAVRAAEFSANLVMDGQFEQVRRETRFRSPYLDKAIKSGVQLLQEGDEVILPANFDQFVGARVVQIVEGEPGGEVHSGRRALRLRGGIYLRKAAPRAFDTREGDLYQVEFHAKGRGDVSVWLHVSGTGKTSALRLESEGRVSASQWTKIEQTFLVVGAGAQEIFPRLAATEEVSIDDLVIRRVMRAGDAQPAGTPARQQERLKAAFVYPLSTSSAGPVGIDDPRWQAIPDFAGFLAYGDQSLLAEPATAMKLGYDATSLYVRVACTEPDMSILSRLDPYTDLTTPKYIGPTAVELFLDPGRTRLSCFQFSVTARGHRFAAFSRVQGTWIAAWEASTRLGPDGYVVLMRIPFASLDMGRPAMGDVWGLNVCRNRATAHGTWAPVGADFHRPEQFGPLVFGSFEQWRGEIVARDRQRLREAVVQRSRGLGLVEIEDRTRRVDAYAAEVPPAGEHRARPAPADWREMAGLYAQGGYVLDSYRRILTCIEWAALDNPARSSP